MGSVFACEHCGSGTNTPRRRTYGRHTWVMCPACHDLTAHQRPQPLVFGRELAALPEPMTAKAGWITYRLAAQEVGYTLWHARDRTQRDRLHDRWNQWMGAVAALQRHAGTLLYRNALEANGFVDDWLARHGAPALSHDLVRWLLPQVVSDTKANLLTSTPDRAILEARAGVPKRGALSR